jgi:hypothetical protein
MGGGAWPFLVRGMICLVDSDNERDPCLLTSPIIPYLLRDDSFKTLILRLKLKDFLEGLLG